MTVLSGSILASDGGAEPLVRPHTPVSTNATVGAFELMVKVYGGGLSAHLVALPLGATVVKPEDAVPRSASAA